MYCKLLYLQCACVHARVRVVHVFVTNEDMHLYNETGLTWVLQSEGDFSGHCPRFLTFQNAYKSYRVSFFGESRNAVSCEG